MPSVIGSQIPAYDSSDDGEFYDSNRGVLNGGVGEPSQVNVGASRGEFGGDEQELEYLTSLIEVPDECEEVLNHYSAADVAIRPVDGLIVADIPLMGNSEHGIQVFKKASDNKLINHKESCNLVDDEEMHFKIVSRTLNPSQG